jgi:hypothetical protein
MAVYRVDLKTVDPDPVFDWVRAHVPGSDVVRNVAYKMGDGWYFKCVFKTQEAAEAFHRRWYPDELDHSVPVFSWNLPPG